MDIIKQIETRFLDLLSTLTSAPASSDSGNLHHVAQSTVGTGEHHPPHFKYSTITTIDAVSCPLIYQLYTPITLSVMPPTHIPLFSSLHRLRLKSSPTTRVTL